MRKTLVPILVLFMMFLLTIVSAQRQLIKRKPKAVRLFVKAELISPANHYVGVCPVTVKMTGKQ